MKMKNKSVCPKVTSIDAGQSKKVAFYLIGQKLG
jgi:hypothetical protein